VTDRGVGAGHDHRLSMINSARRAVASTGEGIQMTRVTAGQAVVEALRVEGVEHIFGIVGADSVEILDALYGRDDIRWIGTRHEQGAAHMADAYARSSGRPGVCMACVGPGATNLVTGLAGAYMASSPVVAIIGSPPSGLVHRDSFQEFDQLAMFRPITKAQLLIQSSARIPELFRQAFRIALTGKPGPVLVALQRDMLNDTLDLSFTPPALTRFASRVRPSGEALERALDVLSAAHKPIMIVGGGVTNAEAADDVVKLADRLSAGMIACYARNDAVPSGHPLYMGMLGRAGAPEAAEAVKACDAVIAIGSGLGHFTSFYDHRYIPAGAPLVHIDLNPEELGRHFPTTVGIAADARESVRDLLDGLERRPPQPSRAAWLEVLGGLRKKRRDRVTTVPAPGAGPIALKNVYAGLRRLLPADAVVVVDAGAAAAGAYDLLDFSRPRSFVPPGRFACVGSGLPSAIGAKFANPDRTVVCICGDGGALMNIQELETMVRERISIVILVMVNRSWGSEKAYQKYLYEQRYVGSDFANPPFGKLAELFGVLGLNATRPEELPGALDRAFAHRGPVLLEIEFDPEELPFPARAQDVKRQLPSQSAASENGAKR
jgi:acetolactate synthase-1/2/3 large subunit/sulfoacetaldehyde acetyltransferase